MNIRDVKMATASEKYWEKLTSQNQIKDIYNDGYKDGWADALKLLQKQKEKELNEFIEHFVSTLQKEKVNIKDE